MWIIDSLKLNNYYLFIDICTYITLNSATYHAELLFSLSLALFSNLFFIFFETVIYLSLLITRDMQHLKYRSTSTQYLLFENCQI